MRAITPRLAAALLLAALSFTTTAQAGWQRTGSVTGPRGGTSWNASGSCANGSCARQSTITGPQGYAVNRQSNASCANGVCTREHSATGADGRSVSGGYTVTYPR